MESRWKLTGKRVVVTGSTKGIGLAIATEMIGLGATVTVVSRSEDDVNATAERLCNEYGAGRAIGVACDVGNRLGREKLIEQVQLRWGALDCLVNNAGVNVRASMNDATEEQYRSIMNTNLDGTYFLCKGFYSLLCKGQAPCIVNVSSVAGVGSTGTGAIYAMSKAAIVQLTKSLACEWAKDHIRVNCIAPWITNTPMVASQPASVMDKICAATPMKRGAEPEEMAAAVTWFALPASSFCTGQTMCVDGGLTSQLFAGPCTE
mmetsp:Transcript_35872/g.91655  ORF Transcript_35872/g.91655 Transcript_35872/m.91655 type:complete len:262 (-) Transcript_35872:3-788(-)